MANNTPNSIEVVLDVIGVNIANSINKEFQKLASGGTDALLQNIFKAVNITQLKNLATNSPKISAAMGELITAFAGLSKDFAALQSKIDTATKTANKNNTSVSAADRQKFANEANVLKSQGGLLTKRFGDQLKSDLDALTRDKKAISSLISKNIKAIDQALSEGLLSSQDLTQLRGTRTRLQNQANRIANLPKDSSVSQKTVQTIENLARKVDQLAGRSDYRTGVANKASESAAVNLRNSRATQASMVASAAQKRTAIAQEQAARAVMQDIAAKRYTARVFQYSRPDVPQDESLNTTATSKAAGTYIGTQKLSNSRRASERQLRSLYNSTVESGNAVVAKLQGLEARASGYGNQANFGSGNYAGQVNSFSAGGVNGFLNNARAARGRLIQSRRQTAFQAFTATSNLSGQQAEEAFNQLIRKSGGAAKFFGITTADILNELRASGQIPDFSDPNIIRNARGQAAQFLVGQRQIGRNNAVDRSLGLTAARQALRIVTGRNATTNGAGRTGDLSRISGAASSLIDQTSRLDPKTITQTQIAALRSQGEALLTEAQAVAASIRQDQEIVRQAAVLAQRNRSQIDQALRVGNTNRETIPANIRQDLERQRASANAIIDASKQPLTARTIASARAYTSAPGPAFTAEQLSNAVRNEFTQQQRRNATGRARSLDRASGDIYQNAISDLETAYNVRAGYIDRLGRRVGVARDAINSASRIPGYQAPTIDNTPDFDINGVQARLNALQSMAPGEFERQVARERRRIGSALSRQQYQEFRARQIAEFGANTPEADIRRNFGQAVNKAGGIFKYASVNERDVNRDIANRITGLTGISDPQQAARQYADFNRQLGETTRNVQQATRAFNQQQRQLRNLNVDATTFGDQIGLAVRRFAAFAVGTGGLFAVIGALRSATDESLKLEKAQTRLGQILGVDRRSVSPVIKASLSGGIKTGVKASDTLAGVDFLAQAGFKDINQLSDVAGLLNRVPLTATFGSISETVDGLLALNNQFNKSLGDTGAIFDTLNQVAGDYAVEVKDIFDAIKRGGSTFSEAGGDLKDYIKLVTLVRSSSRENAETIGNFFKSISFRLLRPENLKLLQSIGVNTEGGISDILSSTADTFGKRYGQGEQLKGNKEAIQLAGQIAGLYQGGRFLTTIDAINKDQGKIDLSFAKAPGSFQRETDKALEDLSVSFNRIGQAFATFANEIVGNESIRTFGKTTADIAEISTKLAKFLGPVAIALTGIVGAKLATPLLTATSSAFRRFGSGGISQQSQDESYKNFPILLQSGIDVNKRARDSYLNSLRGPGLLSRTLNSIGLNGLSPRLGLTSVNMSATIDALAESRINERNVERAASGLNPLTPAERFVQRADTSLEYRRGQRRTGLAAGGIAAGIVSSIVLQQMSANAEEELVKNPTLQNARKALQLKTANDAISGLGLAATIGAINPIAGAALGASAVGISLGRYLVGNKQLEREDADQTRTRSLQNLLKNGGLRGANDILGQFQTRDARDAGAQLVIEKALSTKKYRDLARAARQNPSAAANIEGEIGFELIKDFGNLYDFLSGKNIPENIKKLIKSGSSRSRVISGDLGRLLEIRNNVLASDETAFASSGNRINNLFARTVDTGGFTSAFTAGLERANSVSNGYGFNANLAAARLREFDSAQAGYNKFNFSGLEKASIGAFLKSGQPITLENLSGAEGIQDPGALLNFATQLTSALGGTLESSLQAISTDLPQALDSKRQEIADRAQQAFQRRIQFEERRANINRAGGAAILGLESENFGINSNYIDNVRTRALGAGQAAVLSGRISSNDFLKQQLGVSALPVGTSSISSVSGLLRQNAIDRVQAQNAKDDERLISLKQSAVELEKQYNEEKRLATQSLQTLDKNIALVTNKFSLLQAEIDKQRSFQEGASRSNPKFTKSDRDLIASARTRLIKPLAVFGDITPASGSDYFKDFSNKEIQKLLKIFEDPTVSGLQLRDLGFGQSTQGIDEVSRILRSTLGQRNSVTAVEQLVPSEARYDTSGNSSRALRRNIQNNSDSLINTLNSRISNKGLIKLEEERSKYITEQNKILDELMKSNLDQIDVIRMQTDAALQLTTSMQEAAKTMNDFANNDNFSKFVYATEQFGKYVAQANAGGRLEIGIEPIQIDINAKSDIFAAYGKLLKRDIYAAIRQTFKGANAGEDLDPAKNDPDTNTPTRKETERSDPKRPL